MKITSITLAPIQTHRRTGAIGFHLIVQLDAGERAWLGDSDLDWCRISMPDLEAVRV
ncbi:hypothetical protein [Oceanicola sp. S124]|uniref:hypothetical protein n=1 Tax=Oceanicola sp. S124 TaxID=1042378 RepID=UPI0002FD23BF|nr:hypothetical protein [Oceanicola sp. S124]